MSAQEQENQLLKYLSIKFGVCCEDWLRRRIYWSRQKLVVKDYLEKSKDGIWRWPSSGICLGDSFVMLLDVESE